MSCHSILNPMFLRSAARFRSRPSRILTRIGRPMVSRCPKASSHVTRAVSRSLALRRFRWALLTPTGPCSSTFCWG